MKASVDIKMNIAMCMYSYIYKHMYVYICIYMCAYIYSGPDVLFWELGPLDVARLRATPKGSGAPKPTASAAGSAIYV